MTGHGFTTESTALTNDFILRQLLNYLLPECVCDHNFGPVLLQDRPFADTQGSQHVRILSGAASSGMDWLTKSFMSVIVHVGKQYGKYFPSSNVLLVVLPYPWHMCTLHTAYGISLKVLLLLS